MKPPNVEQAVAVFLLLVNSLVLVEASRLWSSAEQPGLGPGKYLAILGFLLLIFNVIFIAKECTRSHPGQTMGEVFGRQSTRAGVAVALMIGHAVLTPISGFFIATAFFLGLFFRILSDYTITKSILLAIGLAVLLHLVFVVAFSVPLPALP